MPSDTVDPLRDLLDRLRRERFTPSPAFPHPVDKVVDDSDQACGRRRRALESALTADDPR